MPVSICYSDTAKHLAFPRRFRNFLVRAMSLTKFVPADGQVNFVFLDEESMTELNAMHLHHSGSTDVITYDLRPAADGEPSAEIYICPAVAAKYAAELGNTLSREICLYAVHGLLHLSGLDDLTPEARIEMRKGESQTMSALAKSFQLDQIATFK